MTTNSKERNSVIKTRTAIGAASLAGLLMLTGCGSSEPADGSESPTDTPSSPAGGPGGIDSDQLEEIQACLEAAGLEDELPTGQPTGSPGDLPSDLPSDAPTDFPTDVPSGAPDGGFGALQDPEVQEALTACGLDLPQAPGVETN